MCFLRLIRSPEWRSWSKHRCTLTGWVEHTSDFIILNIAVAKVRATQVSVVCYVVLLFECVQHKLDWSAVSPGSFKKPFLWISVVLQQILLETLNPPHTALTADPYCWWWMSRDDVTVQRIGLLLCQPRVPPCSAKANILVFKTAPQWDYSFL